MRGHPPVSAGVRPYCHSLSHSAAPYVAAVGLTPVRCEQLLEVHGNAYGMVHDVGFLGLLTRC